LSASVFGLDLRCAILAADLITLSFSFSSKGFRSFGIPLGMVLSFYRKVFDLSMINCTRERIWMGRN